MILLTKILLLCLLPAIIIWFLSKRKFDTLVFGVYLSLLMISIAESILGRYKFSLLEDFDYLSFSNIALYVLLAGVANAVCYFILIWIFKDTAENVIKCYISLFSLEMLLILLIGKNTNISFIVLSVVNATVSVFWVLVFKNKVATVVLEKKNLYIMIPALAFSFMMFFYFPNELFLTNYNDMLIPYTDYLLSTFAAFVVFFFVFVGLLICLPEKLFSIYYFSLCGVVLLSYIQANFLNGKLALMDGDYQTWDGGTLFANIEVWHIAILLLIIIAYIFTSKKKIVLNVVCALCAYVFLIQVATISFLAISSEKPEKYCLTTEDSCTLAQNDNTIVFVLDWFDTQIVDQLEEEDSNFFNPLVDFTYYENCTSYYAYTGMELPLFCTGIKWESDMSDEEYCKYAYENSSFLSDIDAMGKSIGIFTFPKYLDNSVVNCVENYKCIDDSFKINDLKLWNLAYKSSKYKAYPYVNKMMNHYSTNDFNGLSDGADDYDTSNDAPFYDTLISEKLSVADSGNGAYRLYHLKGAHMPYNMDEECCESEETSLLKQSKGALKLVFEYIKQMKELGIYDDATIIVTADHGQNNQVKGWWSSSYSNLGLDECSNPILFVKFPSQNHDSLLINRAPITQMEIVETIAESVGLPNGYFQEDGIEDISSEEERTRYMIYRRHNDVPYTQFEINGNAKDWNCWKKDE